jgi:hypothetical protein
MRLAFELSQLRPDQLRPIAAITPGGALVGAGAGTCVLGRMAACGAYGMFRDDICPL